MSDNGFVAAVQMKRFCKAKLATKGNTYTCWRQPFVLLAIIEAQR